MTLQFSPSTWNRQSRTLAACIGAYFAVRFCQVVVGPVVPLVIETFEVTRGTVGLALTGMWAVYALVQVPGGALADRFGERATVVAALVTTALATLGLASTPAFAGFALAVGLLGLGAGVYYNPATMLLDRTVENVGRAIGTHRIGGQVAGVAAPAAAALVALRYGWRETVALGSVLVAVAALAFVRGTDPTAPQRRSASLMDVLDPEPLVALLNRPHTRVTTIAMALVEFVGLAAMSFLPTLLIEHHGFDGRTANLSFAAFFAVAAVTQPLAGWLSDRHGRDGVVVGLAGAGVLGFGGLAVQGPGLVVVIAIALAGVAMSLPSVLQPRMLDGLGADERGAGFGVFRTVYLLVGSTGTVVVGAIADAGGWRPAVALLATLYVAVMAILLAQW